MIEFYQKDIEKLIKTVEKKKKLPDKFVNTIEYFHSVFAYILSLIEMKKENKN